MKGSHWVSAVIVALCACAPPTEVIFDLRTDVPCAEVESVGLAVGVAGSVESRDPVLITQRCSPEGTTHAIGTYAVVPSGKPVELSVRVLLAEKGFALESDCTEANAYKGCIVARRTLRFVPNHAVSVPIELLLVCRAVACDVDSTCNRLGRCVPATIDPDACSKDVCAGTLGPVGTPNSNPASSRVYSSWVATPPLVAADGGASTTLTLSLRDVHDEPLRGQAVSLNASGSNNLWSTSASATDDGGVFTARLASTTAEKKTVSVTTPELVLRTTVEFK